MAQVGAFFVLGFIARDLSDMMIKNANAEVAGMDSYDLKSDYDFKRAVQMVVEDCYVDGEYISC